MFNRFANPESVYNITPSDTTDLPQPSVIYVGGAGSLKITCATNKETVTFNRLDAGQWLPVKCSRVWSGTTTCSGIIGAF